jgi:hypothetical protein
MSHDRLREILNGIVKSGRSASVGDVAKEAGVSSEQVRKLMKLSGRFTHVDPTNSWGHSKWRVEPMRVNNQPGDIFLDFEERMRPEAIGAKKASLAEIEGDRGGDGRHPADIM